MATAETVTAEELPDGSMSLIAAHEALDGEDVLPGFRCPLESALD